MKLSALKINSARAEEGAWVDDIPDLPGLRLRVRGFGNAADRQIQAAQFQALPRAQRDRGKVSPEASEKILTERLLGAILIDWSGLEGDDGLPLQFDREVAEKLLTDPDFVRFRAAVVWAAGLVAEDEAQDEAAAAKN